MPLKALGFSSFHMGPSFATMMTASWAALIVSCSALGDEANGEQLWAEFNELRGDTLCAKSFECCAVDQRVFATEEQCKRTFGSPLQTAVEKGKTGLDMDQARSCFNEVAAMDCDRWAAALEGDYPASCTGIIQGKPEGATCSSSGECSEGWCGAGGRCTPFGREGESCSVSVVSCTPGVRCAQQRDATHVCERYRTEGAACGSDFHCSSILCDEGSCTKACWGGPDGAHILGTSD